VGAREELEKRGLRPQNRGLTPPVVVYINFIERFGIIAYLRTFDIAGL
jgi:hypothetical protein